MSFRFSLFPRRITERTVLWGLVPGFALVVIMLGMAGLVAVRDNREIRLSATKLVKDQLLIARLLHEVQAEEDALALALHRLTTDASAQDRAARVAELKDADKGVARLAAQAALAAHQQGKFWEYHDLLFQNQRALERASLEQYAKQANLDVERLKKGLDDKGLEAAVDADVKLGEEVNVNGTPTLFINGKRAPNPTEFEPVAKLIDAALGA